MAAFPLPVLHVGQGADMLNLIRSGQVRHPFIPGAGFLWRCPVGHADLTEADGSQTLALNTLQSSDPFPVDVIRGQAFMVLGEVFAGGTISDATAILGDAADDNGLVAITEGLIFTGDPLGVLQSPAAAEFSHRVEPAFSPQLIIATTGGNVVAATTGLLTVCIMYSPLRGLEV